MCGIFGISYGEDGSTAEEWTPTEFLQMMFPAIVHRGPHAFGWMWYDGEDVYYIKHEGRVTDNMHLVGFDADVDESKIKWVVCHVRYFTHGSPSNELNNHPILHGDILGVHNGVIRNYDEILADTGRHDPATEVDSEAIFAAINKHGHRAGLRKIKGDMVTVYTNLEKPATLHVARSEGRPLEICRTPTGAMLFASEGKVIDACHIEHTDYSPLSRNRLIRVRDGKIRERITFKKVDPLVNGAVRGTGSIKPPPVGGPGSFRYVPDKSAPSWFSRALNANQSNDVQRMADQQLRHEQRRKDAKDLQEAVKDPRTRNLRDHDRWGRFYYLGGVLLTEEAYMQAVTDLLEEEEAQ